MHNPAIDKLVQSSSGSENESYTLRWIPCSQITDVESSQVCAVYYASRYHYNKIILVFLGNSEECTPILVSEFARIYSLPTHERNSDVKFRRYKRCLEYRNKLIKGFTKYDDNYYMVADRHFYPYYLRYGFCSKCQML